MNDENIKGISEIKEILKLEKNIKFKSKNRLETYEWIEKKLRKFHYFKESKKHKGIIKKYLIEITGYSESNIDKLIFKKRKTGDIKVLKRTQHKFPKKYLREDIVLLSEIVNVYRGQNGFAIKKICKEMFEIYKDKKFERLSKISVSHLYNLKKTFVYQKHNLIFTKTNPTQVNIGERKKPDPKGIPGFLRVDSVHQGDLNKEKGVYYIHFIDEVTQWDIVVCVERISEYFLSQALSIAFEQFPFGIINFHSDNGSEYINKIVSSILQKEFIKQTKSRARHSNDNALVEGKNASTLRKQFGHHHIPQKNANLINDFCIKYLNPFLNFHRACAFPTDIINSKGKIKKIYLEKDYQLPVDKLLSILNVEKYLKKNVTIEKLKEIKMKDNHFDFTKIVSKERIKLFEKISKNS